MFSTIITPPAKARYSLFSTEFSVPASPSQKSRSSANRAVARSPVPATIPVKLHAGMGRGECCSEDGAPSWPHLAPCCLRIQTSTTRLCLIRAIATLISLVRPLRCRLFAAALAFKASRLAAQRGDRGMQSLHASCKIGRSPHLQPAQNPPRPSLSDNTTPLQLRWCERGLSQWHCRTPPTPLAARQNFIRTLKTRMHSILCPPAARWGRSTLLPPVGLSLPLLRLHQILKSLSVLAGGAFP